MGELVKEIPWNYIGPFGALAVIMFIASCVFVIKMAKKNNGKCDAMTDIAVMKETVGDMKEHMVDNRLAHQDQTTVLKLILDETKRSNKHLASISKNGRI